MIERLCLLSARRPFDLRAVREAMRTDDWDDETREVREASAEPLEANQPGHPERAHIIAVLRTVGGNHGRAARELGINPSTLYRKMRRYGIQRY